MKYGNLLHRLVGRSAFEAVETKTKSQKYVTLDKADILFQGHSFFTE